MRKALRYVAGLGAIVIVRADTALADDYYLLDTRDIAERMTFLNLSSMRADEEKTGVYRVSVRYIYNGALAAGGVGFMDEYKEYNCRTGNVRRLDWATYKRDFTPINGASGQMNEEVEFKVHGPVPAEYEAVCDLNHLKGITPAQSVELMFNVADRLYALRTLKR